MSWVWLAVVAWAAFNFGRGYEQGRVERELAAEQRREEWEAVRGLKAALEKEIAGRSAANVREFPRVERKDA